MGTGMDDCQQKEQRSFGHLPARGGPIVRGPFSVYPPLCLSPTIRTFHRHTKRFFAIVSPSLRCAEKYNRFKRRGKIKAYEWIQKRKKKELKWEITCSFHQPWLHWSVAEALRLRTVRYSGAKKKVYVTVEESLFVSPQMLHVPHTLCIIFNIRLVYYNHPYCFFYCDLDLHVHYLPGLQTMMLFLSDDMSER